MKSCVAAATLDALDYDLERIDLGQLKIGEITITGPSHGHMSSAATALFPETPESSGNSIPA